MVTISSSSSTPKASFDLLMNNTTRTHNFIRPFPSYLSNKEDSLTQKTLNMINPIDDPLSNVDITSKIWKKEPDDAEIGVFGAEKYFNGSMDSDSPRLMSLTNSEVYSQPRSERIVVDSKLNSKKSMGTSSVRSESSWNSQSVLLQNKYGKNSSCSSVQGKKSNPKVIKRSFLANLGCKCACYDGNAVDVDEQNTINPGSRTVMRSPMRKIENELSFSTNLSSELKFQKQKEEEEEGIQRKSLEVFGSPIMDKRSIQKKLAVLPWETNSTIRTEEGGFSMKYSEEDHESGSDASSDLFEIGSLTEKPKPLLASQESDPTSPTCYAPSEVSIEWSVITASAADFSVMSECATSPMRKSIQIPKILNPKSNRRKSSSGILLGCKSHKSVRVSGDSYRNMNTTPSYVPRFPTESRRRRMSGSSISRSQSPAMASHLLYI